MYDPQREVTHVTQLRAAQRLVASHRHVAAGAAQARGPFRKVTHLADLDVAGQARIAVADAHITRLTHWRGLLRVTFAAALTAKSASVLPAATITTSSSMMTVSALGEHHSPSSDAIVHVFMTHARLLHAPVSVILQYTKADKNT